MSYKLITINDVSPTIGKNVYLGDGVVLIGDVKLGNNVNIWPNTTIRADIGSIVVGDNSNIQDNCVIHTDYNTNCIVGKNTTVGHGVILHSANIGNYCLVGMGSIVLDKSLMEDHSMLGAGALLSAGKIIKSGELWLGSPAKCFRQLTAEEIEYNNHSAEHYCDLAKLSLNKFSL